MTHRPSTWVVGNERALRSRWAMLRNLASGAHGRRVLRFATSSREQINIRAPIALPTPAQSEPDVCATRVDAGALIDFLSSVLRAVAAGESTPRDARAPARQMPNAFRRIGFPS